MRINSKYLHQRQLEIKFDQYFANQQLAHLMTRYMTLNGAVGLAANQVGYQKRLFVMNTDGIIRHCFNPEVVEISDELAISKEGCLSYPKSWIEVARPVWINVKYYSYKGEPKIETLRDLSARCYLHELDHLNGITMYQRNKEQPNVSPKS